MSFSILQTKKRSGDKFTVYPVVVCYVVVISGLLETAQPNAGNKRQVSVHGEQTSRHPLYRNSGQVTSTKHPINRKVPSLHVRAIRYGAESYDTDDISSMLHSSPNGNFVLWMQPKHSLLAQAVRAVHYFSRHVVSQRIERCKTALNKSNAIGDGNACEMCKILFGLFPFSWHEQSWHNRTKYKILAFMFRLNLSLCFKFTKHPLRNINRVLIWRMLKKLHERGWLRENIVNRRDHDFNPSRGVYYSYLLLK